MTKTKKDKQLKSYLLTAEVFITAESEADAQIEVINLMNAHDIVWDCEEQENGK